MRHSLRSTTSSATSPSSAKRCVRVLLLNQEEINVFIDTKTKLQEVFNQVCEHLGLRESEYFGLAQLVEGEYHFVELDMKIQKLVPRGWKIHSSGERPPLLLYFRVQFYVDHIALLRERVTRQLYYLQLRDNLLHHTQMCGEERCFLLAAYALQADQGPYSHIKHTDNYFDPREYFPAWVISRHGEDYIVRNMPAMHRDLQGMTRMEAQMHFIKDVSSPPIAHNLHFYRLKKRKTDPLGTAWLGVCPKGVEIYEETSEGFKSLLSTFLWPDIGKIYFEKKKFEIRSIGTGEGRKFTYFTGSDDRSKYFLSLCRSTHCFQMSVKPKLDELRHLEAEEKRRYREKLVQGSSEDRLSLRSKLSNSMVSHPGGNSLDQRVSVISSTSSNTTSGIVSDKMHISFDSEDDPSVEIMINSPPNIHAGSFKSPQSVGSFKSPSSAGSFKVFYPGGSPLGGSPYAGSFKSPPLMSTPIHPQAVKATSLPLTMTPSPGPSERSVDRVMIGTTNSVSRTSSGHSQKSIPFTLTPVSSSSLQPPGPAPMPIYMPAHCPPEIQIQLVTATPRPAEVQIQRVTMAPTMTVSSTPVMPLRYATEPQPPGGVTHSNVPKTIALTSMVAHAQSAEKAVPQVATSIPNPKTLALQPPQYSTGQAPLSNTLLPPYSAQAPKYMVQNSQPVLSAPQYATGLSPSLHQVTSMPPPPSYSATHTPVAGMRERANTGPPMLSYYNFGHSMPQRPNSLKGSSHSPKGGLKQQAIPLTPLQVHSGPSSQQAGAQGVSLLSNGQQYSVNVDVHSSLPNSNLTVMPTAANGAMLGIHGGYSSPVNDLPGPRFPPQEGNNINPTAQVPSKISPQGNDHVSTQGSQMAPLPSQTGAPQELMKIPQVDNRGSQVQHSKEANKLSSNQTTPTKQGRANSFGKHEQLVASQRISPNPENRRPRERRSKTCPVHGSLADEIRSLEKNHSVPLLKALFHDPSLMHSASRCSCGDSHCHDDSRHAHSDSEKSPSSLHFASSSSSTLNEPGTLVRPVSWHSDTFRQAIKHEHKGRQSSDGGATPVSTNTKPVINMQNGHSVTNGGLLNNITPIWSQSQTPYLGMNNYRLSQSHGALASIGLSGGSPPMFPARLTSGGHSPNGSLAMDHMEANVGLA